MYSVSQKKVIDVLELFSTEYKELEIRADRFLPVPFVGYNKIIYVNTNVLDKIDLWHLNYLVIEIEISIGKLTFIRKLTNYLNLIFFLNIILIFLFLIIIENNIQLAIVLTLLLLNTIEFLIIMVVMRKIHKTKKYLYNLVDVTLNCDEIDLIRSNKISKVLTLQFLDYPIDILYKIKNLII
ncbi:MAG: hypothetical protein NZZ41_03400 [Candidatus Dojkabacteria bacterium]|nr:hypothetical protein [Candidatus Dojkabacteria bacterium]